MLPHSFFYKEVVIPRPRPPLGPAPTRPLPHPGPALHPSPDQSGQGECVHCRLREQGDRLPGWRVYRGCCPSLALFLSSLDILDLPAHGVPLSGEVFHSQVLVRCGPVQAEHECWGQADEGGVTEMGNPDRQRDEMDSQ